MCCIVRYRWNYPCRCILGKALISTQSLLNWRSGSETKARRLMCCLAWGELMHCMDTFNYSIKVWANYSLIVLHLIVSAPYRVFGLMMCYIIMNIKQHLMSHACSQWQIWTWERMMEETMLIYSVCNSAQLYVIEIIIYITIWAILQN